jgi:hypothetical protein
MERRRAARLSSPTWVEANVSHPDTVAEDVTASPPPTAATVPPKEGAAEPPPLPSGMHNPTATHASPVSTNMSVHEDLSGHRLISICDLVAPPPESSYPDSADEGYVSCANASPEFQAAVDFCFACSDDSSEEDYDLAREFSMVGLAVQGDNVANDAANDMADPSTSSPVEPLASLAAPRAATPTNHA